MNTSRLLSALTAVLAILIGSNANAQIPAVPVGTLSVNQSVVRNGTFPLLTWNINYPSTVTSVVNILADGTLVATSTGTVDVRILGASVIAVTTDYYGNVLSSSYVPVYVKFAYNTGSWQQIFYGNVYAVNPSTIVLTKSFNNGDKLDFGAQYNLNGSLGPFINSINNTNNNRNILALKNGDYPPVTCPLYNQPTIASFLKPYMAADGRIQIGPKDVIYLFEITHTDPTDPGFDMNDCALLCTFR